MAFLNSIFRRKSEVPEPEIAEAEPEVVAAPSEPERAPEPAGPKAVDFVAIYEAAGVAADQRKKVNKAQDLLRTLPAQAPAQVKRDIVEAAFKAFDIPTSKIVAAAKGEMNALKAFIAQSEDTTARIQMESAKQIADLQAKIAEVKASMAKSIAEQESRAQAARDEMLKVEPILQFFARESAEASDRDSVEVQVDQGKDE
jgi:hypothetical protein